MADIKTLTPGQLGEVNVILPLCDGNQIVFQAPTKLSEDAFDQLMAVLGLLKHGFVEPRIKNWEVRLVDVGEKKIQCIKETRGFSGMGLKEAKDLVERAPCTVWEGTSETRAHEITAKLRSAGATVAIEQKYDDGLEDMV